MEAVTKKIQHRTGMTINEYNSYVFDTYLMCLSEVSRTTQHLQLLLINRPINNWFLKEIKKVNEDFIQNKIPFIALDKKQVKQHYKDALRKISQNYPSALIDAIKIQKIEPLLTLCN